MDEPSSKRVALFGQFGGGNLGNEATLVATVLALRRRHPQARVVLISAEPSPVLSIGPYDCVPHDPAKLPSKLVGLIPWRVRTPVEIAAQLLTEPYRRGVARSRLGNVDLLLVPGTGIADDFYQRSLDAPLHLLRWCKVARATRTPVCFASIGAGPVEDRVSVRWLRRALALADARTYRDAASRSFAERIGVDVARDSVLPDLVFSLPVDRDGIDSAPWPPRTIAVGVMSYTGWNVSEPEGEQIYRTYIAKMATLVRALLDAAYDVRLIVGHRRDDKRAVDDVARAVRAAGSSRGVLWAEEIRTHDDVLQQVAKSELVVATRFHNVVLSVFLERPVISIGYAQKNIDLMTEMGFQEYCHVADSFDPARVLAQIRSIAQLPGPPVDALRTKLRQYRASLEEQFDRIFGF